MTRQTTHAPPAPVVLGPAAWDEIEAAWSGPGRHYHALPHLDSVLAAFDRLHAEGLWRDPPSVWLALVFHDAVYVPGRGDNEARSAELARAAIARWGLAADVANADRVAHLVLLTARHGSLTDAELDPDARLFLDVDMAVLGAPEPDYDAYERGIAAEYAPVVGVDAYRRGRAAFLDRLVTVPRLFFSERFHAALDGPARANLRRARARLADVSGAAP